MKALVAGFHMLYRLSPDLKFQTVFTLPQKKDAQYSRCVCDTLRSARDLASTSNVRCGHTLRSEHHRASTSTLGVSVTQLEV